jgi:hypothetical protein
MFTFVDSIIVQSIIWILYSKSIIVICFVPRFYIPNIQFTQIIIDSFTRRKLPLRITFKQYTLNFVHYFLDIFWIEKSQMYIIKKNPSTWDVDDLQN